MMVDLDEVDRRLIGELIADGRATYAQLAPAVGLSQAAIRTRVQRLLDHEIIKVNGRADPASFGLGVFAFAFCEVGGETDKVAARLAESTDAAFIAVGAGRFDLIVELRCRDEDHLLRALDGVRCTDGVRRVQSATVLHYDKQDWSGVGDQSARARSRTPTPSHDLDEIDRRLILELMADGRATYAALAPAVGLSQAAVRDRVIDLLETNVVTVQAVPVADAMGIAGFAGLSIRASSSIRPLVADLVDRPEVTLVARTLGRYDIVAEVWFEDTDHLADLVDELRDLPGTGTIDTVPYLHVAKEEFDAGLRR